MTEPTSTTPRTSDLGVLRALVALGGFATLVVGVLILAWPGRTAAVVAGVIAVYAVVTGVVYIAIGVFGARRGGWWRLGYVVLGLLFVVAAVLAFANLRATAAFIAVFLGIMIGAVWVVQGVGTIALARQAPSTTWAMVSGVVSVLGGVVLLFSPLVGAAVLWWMLGIALAVIGIVQIVHAFAMRAAPGPAPFGAGGTTPPPPAPV